MHSVKYYPWTNNRE